MMVRGRTRRAEGVPGTRSRFALWLAVPVFLVVAFAVVDRINAADTTGRYEQYVAAQATHIDDLLDEYFAIQRQFIGIIPPGLDLYVHPAGIKVFDPAGFDKTFLRHLAKTEIYGATVYPILITEEPDTGRIRVTNLRGKEIASFDAEPGYSPDWLALLKYPDLYTRLQGEIDRILYQYDPSRIGLEYQLITAEELPVYLEGLAAAQAPPPGPIAMSLNLPQQSVTNLCVSGLDQTSTGMCVQIAYPFDAAGWPSNSYTNDVDIFVTDDLVSFWWDQEATVSVATNTNYVVWVDTDFTNATPTIRFYALGNADLNSDTDPDDDGLTWAEEKFLYHSSPTNSDTDGDGIDDYEEAITYNTDPSNDDTNPPTAAIVFPAAGTSKVWVP